MEGDWYPQFEKQLAGMDPSERYTAEQNFYGNGQPGMTAANGTLGKYGAANPVWWAWYQQDTATRDSQRGLLINQMKALLNGPDAPQTSLANDTRTLLKAYDSYQEQLNAGAVDGWVGQSQSAINQQWKDNLYATVAAHPEVTNVVTGLFLSLPSAGETVPASAPGENAAIPGDFAAKTWNAA